MTRKRRRTARSNPAGPIQISLGEENRGCYLPVHVRAPAIEKTAHGYTVYWAMHLCRWVDNHASRRLAQHGLLAEVERLMDQQPAPETVFDCLKQPA